MTKEEVIKLIGICSANYRGWPEKGKEEDVADLWYAILKDESLKVGQLAIFKHMTRSHFPPTIADLRAAIVEVTTEPGLTPMDAWGEVKAAIRRYGWNNEGKAMASMSETTQRVVRSIGYQTLCQSENEMADRAHFLKVFETLDKRAREDALLMPGLRDAIRLMQGKNNNPLLEG